MALSPQEKAQEGVGGEAMQDVVCVLKCTSKELACRVNRTKFDGVLLSSVLVCLCMVE